ncbi:50S ribosomal protein L11 methyltransferase [Pseudohongiella acticola]|jgi:ribosomal protein L11 methyltransferase|uniref:50S ribosomal protein L11 methyltransferase n=1 Tax=Pseudohongiella acticola TaxID=1524254 RepID=UPI0030EE7B5B
MPWLQIKARITDAEAPLMEQLFQSAGAVSVTLLDAEDEPVFQLDPDSTPLWQQTMLCALYESDADADSIIALITAGSRLQESDLLTENIADQDWERAWMSDFKPMRFGDRLWVCPSWSEPPEPEAVNIMLDPGLAFGSGTHPTTALCLAWLDSQELTNKRVIDYGCGSGILAIAAALLGASSVVAVDNDPQAVTASGNNRDMNGVSPELMTVHLPGESHEPADVVVANILSGPLAELTPVLASLTLPGGKLILSGVLSEQTETLMASYAPYFAMQPPVISDEWVRIEGTRLNTVV